MKQTPLLLFLLPLTTALIDPPIANTVARNTFVDPALIESTSFVPISSLQDEGDGTIAALAEDISAISNSGSETRVDVKSGRVTRVDLNTPLFPGDNSFLWRVSPATDTSNTDAEEDLEQHAITGLQHFLSTTPQLSISPSELFNPNTVRTAVHSNGGSTTIQLSLQRTYKNIPVRDSRAWATIRNGNLVSFGLGRWSEVEVDIVPKISVEEARVLLSEFAGEDLVTEDSGKGDGRERRVSEAETAGGSRRLSERELARGEKRKEKKQRKDSVLFEMDDGSNIFTRSRDSQSKKEEEDVQFEMEILDLCTPELQILILEPQDDDDRSKNPRYLKHHKNKHNHKMNKDDTSTTFKIGGYTTALIYRLCPKFTHQTHEIMEGLIDAHTGYIYSFRDTNDYFSGVANLYPVSNDGQIPDGVLVYDWPMPYMTVRGDGEVLTTSTGGNYFLVGNTSVSLSGKYVHMADQCGSSQLSTSGDFDWGGVENVTDCVTPGFGGEGNTHASRSGFYELNRMIEIARSHLPGNGWLKQRLTANMNIVESCNAFWDGSTVNFYRSSDTCSNTGELAGVFDHEWGHGMDNNDLAPTIVKPSGEGIADLYTALRLGDSCIGRGFFNNPCSQFGDPCTNDCTGVRDIDYDNHLSGAPHTLTWTNANCVDEKNVHCRGLVYSEAVWSLWKRDLPEFYGYDDNTALEIVMRLTFIAAGNVATWYSGNPPFGGCGGDSGYLSYLAADDDDGDITNGTPHMQAIYAAHHRQEIACNEPAVQDSGCEDSPTVAPELTVTPGSMENIVSWTAVTGASFYQVFRTEGVYKCAQGKVLLATVPSDVLNFTDTGLMNGREYYYIVIGKGQDDSCFGPASECIASSPLDGPAFELTCRSGLAVINKDDTPISTSPKCTVFAISGFTGTISLSCDASSTTGVNCTLPSSVTFSSGDEYEEVLLTINAQSNTPDGDGIVSITASDGTSERDAQVPVVVVTPGGNQTATYDPTIGTPKCFASSKECSSGDLLDGKGIDEDNSPNSLDDCSDGNWGLYHVHPSNDRIVVKAGKLDGTGSGVAITERSYATVSATVWSTFATSIFADFYYTSNVSHPDWQYIATEVTSKVREPEVLEVQYEVPLGLEQAVRVNVRYKGTVGKCPSGSYSNYGDVDDLVFIVEKSPFVINCDDSMVVVDKSDAPLNMTRNCTVNTASTFSGPISFSCDPSLMTGVNCIAPPDINIASGSEQSKTVSFLIEATPSVIAGEEEKILTYAKAGDTSKESSIKVLIVESGGNQNAAYDGQLGVPRCFAEGKQCFSGVLLDGRGEVGPEPNAPNSLDECVDGNKGDYRVDEQLDAITVRAGRLDGSGSDNDISEGEFVTIRATAFAFNTNDRADFWYTSDAFNVSWQYIGSIYSKLENATENIDIEYQLPWGQTQAVRVRYDYQGNISTCPTTDWGDVDDLVFAVKYVPFYLSCPTSLNVFNAEDAPATSEQLCTIISRSDYEGSLQLSCSSELSGIDCSTTSPIDIQLGVPETNVTISVNMSTSVIVGENGNIIITASDLNANVSKTSIPYLIIEGGGPQTAEYDSELGAPRCYAEGSECSSGNLLDGRGEVGPEPNFPNTLDDCEDGNWGNYHQHPSIDQIIVKSKNANPISEDDDITIAAKVWSTFPDDLFADFYYTSSPEEPDWIFINTVATTVDAGHDVLEVNYKLPKGTKQAVRVNYRYLGNQGTCKAGSYRNYGDADDVVFAVKPSSFSIKCPDDTIRFNKDNTPETRNVECVLNAQPTYNGIINLSCSSLALTGVNCTIPPSIEISEGEATKAVNVTLDADTSVVIGEEGDLLVAASDDTATKNSAINVLIVAPGGSQAAVYDSSFGAPLCDLSGTSCSSGDLLYGRGPVSPEPNFPNTIDDCEDGDKGTHHSDESVDRIIVRSGRLDDDASNVTMRKGEYITIIATVWAYSPLDSADFFITTNPSDPSWDYIGSVNATLEDAVDELKIETMVPDGTLRSEPSLQAVRVNFHYRTDEPISPCLGGSWDDVDDLMFIVDQRDLASTGAPTSSPETRSPSASIAPTPSTGTQSPSNQPSASPSASPSTADATQSPSKQPSASPSASPSVADATQSPSKQPSASPSASPSVADSTQSPSKQPSASPSASPSVADATQSPSKQPSASPSASPSTAGNTQSPSKQPNTPSTQPTTPPSTSPTNLLTPEPTAPENARWYMQFNMMKCYQDCEGPFPCGGPKEFWNTAYDTENECCIKNLGTSDQELTNNCLAGGQ